MASLNQLVCIGLVITHSGRTVHKTHKCEKRWSISDIRNGSQEYDPTPHNIALLRATIYYARRYKITKHIASSRKFDPHFCDSSASPWSHTENTNMTISPHQNANIIIMTT